MAIDENKKKAVKDSEESVKEEESEKALISEEEESALSEEDKENEDAEVSEDEEESDAETEADEKDKAEEKKSESKAKKDPVPAIMIVLIYAIIIAAVLFYVIPTVMVPSFGFTLGDFNTKLEKTDISQRMHSQYTTLTPQFKLVDKNSIKEIWSLKGEIMPEEQNKLDARFKPFVKTYAATEELEHILVEANTRVNDGQLTRMCIYCTFDNQHVSMMLVHFGAVMSTFTDMPFNDAARMLMSAAMEENKSGLYTVRGDIAFKLSYDNVGGQQTYIKLEVLPAKAVSADRIKTTIPVEAAPSESAAPSATSAASETTAASSAP